MLGPRLGDGRVDEHLHLVELVDAEHPARVLAGGSRLAAEVGREAGVAERQLLGRDDLAHVEAGERDLGRARQVEVVVGERVDVRALGRKEAGAGHRLLADEHGREHGREAVLGEMRERGAVERERDERRVADQVAEARAREARRPLHVEAPDLGVLARLRQLGRLARARDLDRVLLLGAVRHRLVRRVRHLGEQLVARRLGRRVLLLGRAQLLLHLLQLGELLGRGLALQLRLPAQLVDRRHERAPALVGGQQRVERLAGALALQRRAVGVRVAAGGLEVDHGVKCRRASSTWATPSSSAEGQIQSARALSLSSAFSTAIPNPAQSRSSRSFSPSPNAIVRSAVKPTCSATNASPLPFEIAGLASSRKYGSDLAM